MKEQEIKNILKEIEKLEKQKNDIASQIKMLQATVDNEIIAQCKSTGLGEIRNSSFTATMTVTTKKELEWKKFLDDAACQKVFIDYALSTANVKVGAEKTFEKCCCKAGINYDSFCKTEPKTKITYSLVPDAAVLPEKMDI